jgi:hypothetical protein
VVLRVMLGRALGACLDDPGHLLARTSDPTASPVDAPGGPNPPRSRSRPSTRKRPGTWCGPVRTVVATRCGPGTDCPRLLLRHGSVYSGGAAWTGAHDVWLLGDARLRLTTPATRVTSETGIAPMDSRPPIPRKLQISSLVLVAKVVAAVNATSVDRCALQHPCHVGGLGRVGVERILQRVGREARPDGKSEDVRELVSFRAQQVGSENSAAAVLDEDLVH